MICDAKIEGVIVKKNHNFTRSGVPMVTLTIKNVRQYLNYKHEVSETTSWHTIHCLDSMMEKVQDLYVGDLILVDGHISHRKREDGPMANQFVYAIHATNITKISLSVP